MKAKVKAKANTNTKAAVESAKAGTKLKKPSKLRVRKVHQGKEGPSKETETTKAKEATADDVKADS